MEIKQVGIRETARKDFLKKAETQKKEGKIATLSEIIQAEKGASKVLLRFTRGGFSFCAGDKKGDFCNESCEGTTVHTVSSMDDFFEKEGDIVEIPHVEGKTRTTLVFKKKRLLAVCAKLFAENEAAGHANLSRRNKKRLKKRMARH
jgi:hypothetical protein